MNCPGCGQYECLHGMELMPVEEASRLRKIEEAAGSLLSLLESFHHTPPELRNGAILQMLSMKEAALRSVLDKK